MTLRYLPSVSCQCRLPSILYRLYRPCLSYQRSRQVDESLLAVLARSLSPLGKIRFCLASRFCSLATTGASCLSLSHSYAAQPLWITFGNEGITVLLQK
jgi:hypothetical protein